MLGVAAVSNSQAVLSTALLSSGAHYPQARYNGDSATAPSLSPVLMQRVAASSAGLFNSSVNYADPGTPVALIVGDFNRDGSTDLAVVNQVADNVGIFLGAGTGTFAPAVTYSTGSGPEAVAMGDFNGDGYADLAVADEGANTIGILLGNGDGTFAPASAINVGASPIALAVSDFNADGIADLAVVQQGGDTAAVLLGNGDGTFVPAVNYAVGSSPASLAIGDFNGDGITDLAVADQGDDSVSILLGNGDGTFAAATGLTVGSAPAALIVADFNGDGKTDLAVAIPSTNTVDILLGNGDGTFGSPLALTLGTAPVALSAGDFNGDGVVDLAIASAANTIATILGNGDGTFESPVSVAVGGGPAALAAGEFNGDGRTDLAVANAAGGSVSVLLGAPVISATSTALTASPNPSSYGQIVTLTAVVSPATATGSVTFSNGATVLGSAPLTDGIAALSLSTLPVGAQALTASYAGDANDSGSVSASTSELIDKAAATLTLGSSLNPSTYGQSVTLTAVVAPASATGSITFNVGSNTLGTALLNSGTASLALSTLSVGTQTITASYAGDANDSSATSIPLTEVINKLVSSITLNSSANPASFGQAITLTATVAPVSATGNVTFTAGTNTLGTALLSNGTASLTLSTLSVGSQTITAIYAGDANDSGATSIPLTEIVNKAVSTIILNSSANPASFGQAITLTAMVAPASATGNVTFTAGTNTLGTAVLGNGVASLTLSTLPVGTQTITASYAGDANDGNSTSVPLTEIVNKAVSTIILNSSANPASFGQAITLTAMVAPASATGNVTFTAGTNTLGTAVLGNGVTSLTLSTLPVGTQTITATYAGDANDGSATSIPLTEVVNKAVSTITLMSSANPAGNGQSITFTAALSPVTATGAVTLNSAGKALGTAALTNGIATLTLSTLSVGSHAITANYPGDTNDLASVSATLTEVISNTVSTTTTLTSTANPAIYNQSVTFTARVSPSTAGGTVSFRNGTVTLGTAVLSSGVATCTVLTLTVGSHSLIATYSGDANDAGSVSAALTEVINKISSVTALSSSVNPSTYGQSVSLTAVVSPATASGNVTFKNGSATLGSVALMNGSAALSVSTFPAGSLTLSANYAGDANDTASASATLIQVVNKAVSAVSLSSSLNPSAYRQSITLSALVTPKTAGGSISFKNGSVTLGTATLSGGTAKLAVSSLTVGSQSVVATYAGDTNDISSNSNVISQTVNKASATVVIKSSANPSIYGQKVSLTATVSPSGATGTVVFKNGSINLGSVPVSNGSATISPSTLAVGTNGITATYSGDANDSGSTSTMFYQSALYSTTTTLSSSLNPAHFGQTVELQAAISSPGTPTGTVSFLDGSASLGQAQVGSGNADLFVTGLTTGPHSLSAVYLGDTNNGGSTASPLNEAVSPDLSVTTLTSSMNPSSLGSPVTLTAAVSPSIGTGKISFYDGLAVLGGAPLVAGQAGLQTALLAGGSHSLTSRYSGDANDSSSVSTALLQKVQAASASGFQPAVTLSADASPVALVAGDFNGDGKADLAVANQAANDVSVFLGAGNGAFSAAVDYSVGSAPVAVVTGDFNGDGRTDLAVALQGANTIAILLGHGDGAFAPTVGYNTGASPIALVVGDFNRDGIADLAAAGQGVNTVSILLGNGDGTFASAVNYNAGATPVSLAVGDFNGDGIADLAVADQSANSVSILLGNGDGTFGAAGSIAVGSAPAALAVTDFNNDGKVDLAVASTGAGTVSILLGNGDGTFGSLVSFATGTAPVSLTVGDFNGDGIPDLATAASSADLVCILLGNGDGTFQLPVSTPAGSGPVALAAGEFNGDARTDLAVADQTGNSVSVLLGAAPLTTTSTVLTASPNPSLYGQTVNFTASVSPPAATGTVTFNDAAVVLGSASLVNGSASIALSTLARGSHLLAAAYSGNPTEAPSTSSALTQIVGSPLTTTATALASSLNPSASGQSVKFTATVSPQSATGSVTLQDGSTTLGQATLNNGTAVFVSSALSFGPHSLTALYSGDSNDSASTSAILSQTVTLPIPPPQPASGPGGSTYSFGAVTTYGPFTIAGSSEYYYIYQPAQPAPASAPAVLFLHGFNFDTPSSNYQLWINHLVRNGYTVVWSYFQTGSDTLYLSNIESDWNAALQKIKSTPGMVQVAVDNTNTALTAVVAHSVGGYLALAIGDAASAPGNAFPKFHAILATEPDQGQLPAYPLTAIDPGTRVVIIEGDEDKPVRLCEAAGFWQDISNIPVANRNVIEVISDSHGSPAQIGNHVFPLTYTTLDTVPPPSVDDRDYNVTWKLSVALLDCAFNGTYCDYALGNGTPEQLNMGAWSDGAPVAPLLYVPNPVTQFQTDCTQPGG